MLTNELLGLFSDFKRARRKLNEKTLETLSRMCSMCTQKVVADKLNLAPHTIRDLIQQRRELSDQVIARIISLSQTMESE